LAPTNRRVMLSAAGWLMIHRRRYLMVDRAAAAAHQTHRSSLAAALQGARRRPASRSTNATHRPHPNIPGRKRLFCPGNQRVPARDCATHPIADGGLYVNLEAFKKVNRLRRARPPGDLARRTLRQICAQRCRTEGGHRRPAWAGESPPLPRVSLRTERTEAAGQALIGRAKFAAAIVRSAT